MTSKGSVCITSAALCGKATLVKQHKLWNSNVLRTEVWKIWFNKISQFSASIHQ